MALARECDYWIQSERWNGKHQPTIELVCIEHQHEAFNAIARSIVGPFEAMTQESLLVTWIENPRVSARAEPVNLKCMLLALKFVDDCSFISHRSNIICGNCNFFRTTQNCITSVYAASQPELFDSAPLLPKPNCKNSYLTLGNRNAESKLGIRKLSIFNKSAHCESETSVSNLPLIPFLNRQIFPTHLTLVELKPGLADET
jgi:hypothetical protein